MKEDSSGSSNRGTPGNNFNPGNNLLIRMKQARAEHAVLFHRSELPEHGYIRESLKQLMGGLVLDLQLLFAASPNCEITTQQIHQLAAFIRSHSIIEDMIVVGEYHVVASLLRRQLESWGLIRELEKIKSEANPKNRSESLQVALDSSSKFFTKYEKKSWARNMFSDLHQFVHASGNTHLLSSKKRNDKGELMIVFWAKYTESNAIRLTSIFVYSSLLMCKLVLDMASSWNPNVDMLTEFKRLVEYTDQLAHKSKLMPEYFFEHSLKNLQRSSKNSKGSKRGTPKRNRRRG